MTTPNIISGRGAAGGGTAVVTGASSRVGAIYADRLARQGHDLILVARNQARLEALADRLRHETGQSVRVIAADLQDDAQTARLAGELAADASVSVLVNNAGIGAAAPALQSDVEAMVRMIALNVTALTRLTYAVLPGLVSRGRGTIINIASIVAVAPELLNGVYGGSKAFVLALTQSLHKELAGSGVRVQAVLPGATATEFWDIAGHTVDRLPPEMVMAADEMVDASLAGLALGELATIPSLPQIEDWDRFEAARQALMPNLSRTTAAARYRVPAGAAS